MWDSQNRELVPQNIGQQMREQYSETLKKAAVQSHWVHWVYTPVAFFLHFAGLTGIDKASMMARFSIVPNLILLLGIIAGITCYELKQSDIKHQRGN